MRSTALVRIALLPVALVATAFAADPKNTIICVSFEHPTIELRAAFTGMLSATVGNNGISPGWDVKMLSATECAVATTDGKIVRYDLSTGIRIAPDIPIPIPQLQPNHRRRLTPLNRTSVLIWIQELNVGYQMNLVTGAVTQSFWGSTSPVDGLARVGDYVYGVDELGRIVTWKKSGGAPVSVSAASPFGGGAMNQPVLNDGYLYSLIRPRDEISPSYLVRFAPKGANPASPTWDNFNIGTPGWRYANYLTAVDKGNFVFVLMERVDNSKYYRMGRMDVRTRTFSASDVPFSFQSIVAASLP